VSGDAAGKYLCGARPTALRSRHHGRHRGGQRALRRGQTLSIQGTQAAGAPQLKLGNADDAIEVMTGAILAAGQRLRHSGRTVRRRRRLRLAEAIGGRRTPYTTSIGAAIDSRQGALLLETGTLLRAPEIAVAASAGMARVRVSSQPAIMVVSTGDELIEPGDPSPIIRCAAPTPTPSRPPCASAASAASATIMCRTMSNADARTIGAALTTHEVVVLSGGVSMGKFDLVPKVLQQLGVQAGVSQDRAAARQTHVVRHRPAGQAVFGLPGNPVSTLVCLIRYVIPAIAEAMGTKRGRPNAWPWRRRSPSSRRSPISCPWPSNTTIGAAPGPIRGHQWIRGFP
jgi:molybdopterin molybdotransferase